MQGISAPIIVTIITIILSAVKKSAKNTKVMNWIDPIGLTLGAMMGIVAFYCVPDTFLLSDNVFDAILIGLFSGLSALGADNSMTHMRDKVKKSKENRKAKDEAKQDQPIE